MVLNLFSLAFVCFSVPVELPFLHFFIYRENVYLIWSSGTFCSAICVLCCRSNEAAVEKSNFLWSNSMLLFLQNTSAYVVFQELSATSTEKVYCVVFHRLSCLFEFGFFAFLARKQHVENKVFLCFCVKMLEFSKVFSSNTNFIVIM